MSATTAANAQASTSAAAAPPPAGAAPPPRLSRRLDLRWRLMLLVVLAMLPVFGLTLVTAWTEREVQRVAFRDEVTRLAEVSAGSVAQILRGSEQLLLFMASAPQLQHPGENSGNELLAHFLAEVPSYSNLGVVAPDGRFAFSAIPAPPAFSAADATWFRRVQVRQGTVIGDYGICRLSHEPVLVVASGAGPEGQPRPVVFVSIRLKALQECIASPQLPPHSVIGITDRNGILLARHPVFGQWQGRKANSWDSKAVNLRGLEGLSEGIGMDGVARYYRYLPVPGSQRSLFIAVGFPQAEVTAAVSAHFWRDMLLLGMLTLLALICAWFGSELLILRPVRQLTAAARNLAAGDWQAVAQPLRAPSELRQLAQSFAVMASTLRRQHEDLERQVADRTAELRDANLHLQTELTERRQAAEERQHQAELAWRSQAVLLQLAKTTPEDFADYLRQVAEAAAALLQVGRLSIWWLSPDGTQIVCAEALDAGPPQVHSRGECLLRSAYPAYFAALERQRVVATADPVHDPRTAEFAADYLERLGITAMLDAAVIRGGKLIGIVCLEHRHSPRVWSQIEQDFASSLADQLVAAIETDERRRTEAALQRSEALLRATLESTADGILVIGMQRRIVAWNERFLHLWNLPEEVFAAGNEFVALALAQERVRDAESFRTHVEALYADPEADGMDLLEMTDGRTLEQYSHPQRLDGKPVGRVWSFRDITARRRAEAELQQLNEHLEQRVQERTAELEAARRQAVATMHDAEMQRRKSEDAHRRLAENTRNLRMLFRAIENSPAMVIITDRNAQIEYVNPMFTEVTGYSTQEVMNRNPRLLKSGSHPPEFYAEIWGVLQQGRQWRGEICNRKKTGELFWVASSIAPVRGSGGEITNYVAVNSDITERKRFIQQLEAAKHAAEAANRSKSAFLANMTHEIRTPMNAILGFTQLLQRDPALTPAQQQRLTTINRSGEHLLALINDILELSRIDAGRVTFSPTPFDLLTLVEDLANMFRLRIEAKHLAFSVACSDKVPRYVLTDENKLRQVFINLLGNAAKFTAAGSILWRLSAERSSDGCPILSCEVTDTGPGIAPEEQARLFHSFEQTAAGRAVGGTGLGLAISHQFVRLLGGELTVVSKIGQGSTFAFAIPLGEAGPPPAVRSQLPRVVGLLPGRPVPRILLADDQEADRDLIAQILEPAGFALRSVANGLELLAALPDWPPDLILLDMHMPVLDGYEVLRRLPGLVSPPPPVLAVSASAFVESRLEILSLGASDFLAKPFREAELFAKIAAVLKLEYLYANAAATTEIGLPLTPVALAKLPPPLRREMREATIIGDYARVMELLDTAEATAPDVVCGLRRLAEHFESQRLIELLDVPPAQG